MAGSGYGSMETSESPSSGIPGQGRRRLGLLAGVCFCVVLGISTHLVNLSSPTEGFQDVGLQESQMLWGGRSALPDLPEPRVRSRAARRSQLANFDPAKMYKDPPETDLDHENRIDNYGCMFSDCEGKKTPLLQTVNRLKRLLGKLDSAQKKFINDLKDKPVKTTMKVIMGEPGRLGPRGNRGVLGPQGPIGVTGAQGRAGFIGPEGPTGDEGAEGAKGAPGDRGDQGRQGVKGDRGEPGPRGRPGVNGRTGDQGPRGYPGDNGPAGQDGTKGGPGPAGIAPPGPPGPPGLTGVRGPKGDTGAKGLRGEEGFPGPPGAQGIQGITGGTGGPGKDGPMLPIPKCKGAVSDDKSICHGESNVNWNSFYNAGAYLDIDTSPCKMSDDDVQYFTFLTGNGYAESLTGGSAIYSPTKNGFRVYVASDIAGTQGWWPVQGWVMNQYRLRVSWVAVGKSTGPKSTAVCCGRGESKWAQSGPQSYQNVDAGACSMKGSPVWITAAEGGKAYGTSAFIGTNAAYSVGERFAMMFIRQSDITKARDGGFSAAELSGGKNMLVPKYCQFGEPFPSGEQALDEGKISLDEYPCMGMRVVKADKKIVTNTAGMCCGKTDNNWESDSLNQLSKRVDTSSCGFKDDNVVYITSLGGNSDHWRTTGDTAYSESSSSSFVTKLLMHPTQYSPGQAKALDWHINWCGVGNRGAVRTAAPPPPPLH